MKLKNKNKTDDILTPQLNVLLKSIPGAIYFQTRIKKNQYTVYKNDRANRIFVKVITADEKVRGPYELSNIDFKREEIQVQLEKMQMFIKIFKLPKILNINKKIFKQLLSECLTYQLKLDFKKVEDEHYIEMQHMYDDLFSREHYMDY